MKTSIQTDLKKKLRYQTFFKNHGNIFFVVNLKDVFEGRVADIALR